MLSDTFIKKLYAALADESKALTFWNEFIHEALSNEEAQSVTQLIIQFLHDHPDNANGYYLLANMHYYGKGAPIDYAAAIDFEERAIALGSSSALNNRGSMYYKGLGGPVNYAAAIFLFDQAIACGNSNAMHNRAFMYHKGHGGPVNYNAAIDLYDRASALGNTRAMNNRATMYHKGQGGPVNYKAALTLYERVIALGKANATTHQANSGAIQNLAYMYQNGHGCAVNLNYATKLYYQSYCLSQENIEKISSLNQLEIIAENKTAVKAQYYLTKLSLLKTPLDYINAKKWFNKNAERIAPLIYKDLLKLLDENSTDNKTIQAFSAIIANCKSINQIQFQYLTLKTCIKEEGENALSYYENRQFLKPFLTGNEFFFLGTQQLDRFEAQTSSVQSFECLHKACKFFYHAYLLGDKDAYVLLTQTLNAKKALLENSKMPAYSAIPTEEAATLYDNFVNFSKKEPKDKTKKHINALKEYVTLISNGERKTLFSFFKSLTKAKNDEVLLAKHCIQALMKKKSLEALAREWEKELKGYPALQRLILSRIDHATIQAGNSYYRPL